MNVLITREADKTAKFAALLKKAGHVPYSLPMIECVPVDADVSGHYDYGVFTSLNAVKYFEPYRDSVAFGKIAAVGSATSEALTEAGYTVDMMPDEYSAEGLKKLFSGIDLRGRRILLAGAETRAGDFHTWLKMNGCAADIVTIYKTAAVKRSREEIDSFIRRNGIDVITFASPSAVRAFFDSCGTDRALVAIGRTTAEEIKKYGYECYVPGEYTLEGMIKIIDQL
ncbi:MAG: uroporphyrinogen-III synthase [Deferribacterales bacterium]